MSTNPNFPRRDAPPLPSEAGADETYVPEGEVVSVASNGSKSDGVKSNRAASETETKRHDPEKFGSFTLPPDFLKEALSQPLPRAKEEDLAHDTLAPYRKGGEVHRKVLEEGSAYPGTVEPITVPAGPRAKMESRAEAERAEAERTKKKYMPVFVAVGLIACFAIGGMWGIFERQDGEVEIEAVSPKEDGSAEAARNQMSNSKRTIPAPVEDSAESSEGEEKPRADAPRPSASNGSSTVKADSSKGDSVESNLATTPESPKKVDQAGPPKGTKSTPETDKPTPQTSEGKPSRFELK